MCSFSFYLKTKACAFLSSLCEYTSQTAMLKENEGKSKKKSSAVMMSSAKTPKTACPKKTAPPPGKKPQSGQSKKSKKSKKKSKKGHAETGKLAREIVADMEHNLLHIGGSHHHGKSKGSAKSRKSKSSSKGRHPHSQGHSHPHSNKSKQSKRSSKKSMEFFEVEVTHPGSAVHHHHKNIPGKYPLGKMTPGVVASSGKPKSSTSNKSKKSGKKSGSKASLKKSAKGKKTL